MSNLDIKFFASKDSSSSRLGGGFITSGVIKTVFSVWKSDKSKDGFNVSLPYRKDKDNKVVNEVTFTTKEVSEEVHQFIRTQLGGTSDNGEPAPRVVRESIRPAVAQATSVDVRAQVQKFNKGPIPF